MAMPRDDDETSDDERAQRVFLGRAAAATSATAPRAGGILCECGMPVAVSQVLEGPQSGEYYFECGTFDCATFGWLRLADGQTLVNFRMDKDGQAFETTASADERIRFHVREGAIEFTADGNDKVLARVQVDENDIVGEILAVEQTQRDEALEAVRTNADGMSSERVDKLAKHLVSVKKEMPTGQRPRLPKTRTHRDLATVMLAVRDAVERFCLQTRRIIHRKGSKQGARPPLERVLADTCTDTHIISYTRVVREGYADSIDPNQAIGIGGAHLSSAF